MLQRPVKSQVTGFLRFGVDPGSGPLRSECHPQISGWTPAGSISEALPAFVVRFTFRLEKWGGLCDMRDLADG